MKLKLFTIIALAIVFSLGWGISSFAVVSGLSPPLVNETSAGFYAVGPFADSASNSVGTVQTVEDALPTSEKAAIALYFYRSSTDADGTSVVMSSKRANSDMNTWPVGGDHTTRRGLHRCGILETVKDNSCGMHHTHLNVRETHHRFFPSYALQCTGEGSVDEKSDGLVIFNRFDVASGVASQKTPTTTFTLYFSAESRFVDGLTDFKTFSNIEGFTLLELTVNSADNHDFWSGLETDFNLTEESGFSKIEKITWLDTDFKKASVEGFVIRDIGHLNEIDDTSAGFEITMNAYNTDFSEMTVKTTTSQPTEKNIVSQNAGGPTTIITVTMAGQKVWTIAGVADSYGEIRAEENCVFALSQNYPNPFNATNDTVDDSRTAALPTTTMISALLV